MFFITSLSETSSKLWTFTQNKYFSCFRSMSIFLTVLQAENRNNYSDNNHSWNVRMFSFLKKQYPLAMEIECSFLVLTRQIMLFMKIFIWETDFRNKYFDIFLNLFYSYNPKYKSRVFFIRNISGNILIRNIAGRKFRPTKRFQFIIFVEGVKHF